MRAELTLGVLRRFVSGVLPWLVGAAGFLVYVATLNPWVSLPNTSLVARVCGWSWQPVLTQPLTWAVLYPFGWLPDSWVPLALNLFTAVCAGLVLVLLARSVALLPQDVTRDDPLRPMDQSAILTMPRAWIPPVVSAVLCGLQLTFWEHATSMTAAMIDLLIFAYVIRCLLEFRGAQEERWLYRCTCVYGLGMANDWALVAYLPVFVAALVWITGLGVIYNRRLLLRTLLWWVAGLSAYLWWPLVCALGSDGAQGFGEALKANLKAQQQILTLFRRPAFRVLALVSLLPLLVLSIRWKSHTLRYGDDSGLGLRWTRWCVHLAHGLFLIAAIWLALDPSFSPRHLRLGPPMLSYYYWVALMAGYCTGYFLLLAARAAQEEGEERSLAPAVRKWHAVERKLGHAAGVGIWVMLGIVPVLLLARNLGQIRITNSGCTREYARELWSDLPPGRSVVLTEDPRTAVLLRMESSGRRSPKQVLPLESKALRSRRYQQFMAAQFPGWWPLPIPTNEVLRPATMVKLVSAFAARENVVYAHPSSGLFFEAFVDHPKGLIHQLTPRAAGEAPGMLLPAGVVAANEQIWRQRCDGLIAKVAEAVAEPPGGGPTWARPLLAKLRLMGEANATAGALGEVYSKALNYWGVQMQRLGRWEEAGVWYEGALALNPWNLSAQLNTRYNQRWRRGDRAPLDSAAAERELRGLLDYYRNWAEVLDADGPVDEPTFLLRVGQVYLSSGNYRQASAEFARCAELSPDWAEPKLWQALSLVAERNYSAALSLLGKFQEAEGPGAKTLPAQVLLCQTAALNGLGRTNEAAACLEDFVTKYRQDPAVLTTAANVLEQNRQYRAELPLLQQLLTTRPDDSDLLARAGWCQLQLGQFGPAVESLSRALSWDPANAEARLHRGVALLAGGKAQAAKEDFAELAKLQIYAQNARFGLAAVARQERNTNAAIEFYQEYLTNTVPGSREYRAAEARLRGMGMDRPSVTGTTAGE